MKFVAKSGSTDPAAQNKKLFDRYNASTGNFTAAEISEFNKALDSLDSLMSELDKLIGTAKAEMPFTFESPEISLTMIVGSLTGYYYLK